MWLTMVLPLFFCDAVLPASPAPGSSAGPARRHGPTKTGEIRMHTQCMACEIQNIM